MFNSSIEDNIVETKNKTLMIIHESLNVSKECVISELNPIEDFNTHLDNGFDSKTGIFKFVFSYRSIFYLLYCMIVGIDRGFYWRIECNLILKTLFKLNFLFGFNRF